MDEDQRHEPAEVPPRRDFALLTSLRWDPTLVAETGSPLYLLEQHHARLLDAAQELGFTAARDYLVSTAPNGKTLGQVIMDLLGQAPSEPMKVRLEFPPSSLNSSSHASSSIGESAAYRPQLTAAPVPAEPAGAFFPSTLASPDALPPTLERWNISLFPERFVAPLHPPRLHKTTARAAYDDVCARHAKAHDVFLRTNSHPSAVMQSAESNPRMTEILLGVPCTEAATPSSEDHEIEIEVEISEGTRATPFFYRDGRWITPRREAGGCLGVARRYALAHKLAVEGKVSMESVTVGEKVWIANGVRGFSWGRVGRWGES